MYLVCEGGGRNCGKLPIALTVCPCCGEGVKQSRGFAWISTRLFSEVACNYRPEFCGPCPLALPDTKCGLLWVGEKFYPTVYDFEREAAIHGISKRIAQIPRDLELGKTWVMLAHPRAVVSTDGTTIGPGIFRAFIPQRVEYILTGKETTEEMEKLEKRGLTLVEEVRDIDLQGKIGL
jgi:hypothetical protein